MAICMNLSGLKRAVVDEIRNDPTVTKELGDNATSTDPYGQFLFDHQKNPSAWDKPATYLTVQLHIPRASEDRKWLVPTLELQIISHEQHLTDSSSGSEPVFQNRNDYLADLLTQKFHGRNDLGSFSPLLLISDTEGVLENNCLYRKLQFETSCLNSFCEDRG